MINDVGQGNGGTDFLDGGEGNDRLNGGAGNDFYDFNSTSESAVGIGNTDIIQSFNFGRGSRGDEINASSIDANVVAPGDQAFQFIDTAPFTPNYSGQINVINGSGESTLVQLNTDNDVFAESQIQVNDGSGAPRILGRRRLHSVRGCPRRFMLAPAG